MRRHSSPLSRRGWRRLERHPVDGHRQDLAAELDRLTQQRVTVAAAGGSWVAGVVSLDLAGEVTAQSSGRSDPRRLAMAGIAPLVARRVIDAARSGTRVELCATGRYGRFWWIALGGEREQMILASHVRLGRDPGRPYHSATDLPVLSGSV